MVKKRLRKAIAKAEKTLRVTTDDIEAVLVMPPRNRSRCASGIFSSSKFTPRWTVKEGALAH